MIGRLLGHLSFSRSFLTSGYLDVSPFEQIIGRSVTPAMANVQANFGFLCLCFRVNGLYRMDGQTDGWTSKTCNVAYQDGHTIGLRQIIYTTVLLLLLLTITEMPKTNHHGDKLNCTTTTSTTLTTTTMTTATTTITTRTTVLLISSSTGRLCYGFLPMFIS